MVINQNTVISSSTGISSGKAAGDDRGWLFQPDQKYIKDMFFRKPGLPILMVRFPDGRDVPYWNTFYQEVTYRTVDAQDLMQAAGLQYTESVMLAEVLIHRPKKERNRQRYWLPTEMQK